MLFFARVAPALLAASSLVQAASLSIRNNDDFFAAFINALEGHNLTHVADSYKKSVESNEGQANIQLLKSGEDFTILAPKDGAFDPKYPILDLDVLQYDQLWGSVDNRFKTSDHSRRDAPSQSHETAPSTFPRRSNTGNGKRTQDLSQYQVQVIDQFFSPAGWKRWFEDRIIFVDRPVGNAKVVDRFTFKNIIILIIDDVLTLPVKVSELLCKPLIKYAPDGFPKFKAALEKAGVLDLVDTKDKLTIFVPVDSDCDYDGIIKNHFFFGKIVFGPLFPSVGSATAQSGKKLEFSFENDIHYVSCGKDTRAVVLRNDVIPQNGVMHIIDRPLKCD
ncbi:unnamed protein product [Rhizoctonia solani]|uniref:FAS1 domain-containing protein n=1 Tax=Rhizoctonia solani TaxID=456999 RepID=A0A8H2X4A3_9AGAM|nr:unnamed protein product [Rhizoctonia solani]